MCVSAEVSFGMAGLLVAGGTFAIQKARHTDIRYVPLAAFPVLVGVQQAVEGTVWIQADAENLQHLAALVYLFFTWMVWTSYVPYMTARLEGSRRKRLLFLRFAQAGFVLGLVLYLPNFWNPDWLEVGIINHSIAYQCTLITDSVLPRSVPYFLYLALIALPPLLSSHRALNIFGAGLVAFVPLTYFFFYYAHISVLCFFAAVMTLYIIYVILHDKCETAVFIRPV